MRFGAFHSCVKTALNFLTVLDLNIKKLGVDIAQKYVHNLTYDNSRDYIKRSSKTTHTQELEKNRQEV